MSYSQGDAAAAGGSPKDSLKNSPKDSPGLLARVGCGHLGYRVNRPGRALLLAVLLIAPVTIDVHRALTEGFREKAGEYVDFRIFYEAAEAFAAHPGENIYALRPNYLYPPLFVTLFAKLLPLPENSALAAFQIVKWLAVFICLWLAWRICSPRGEDLPPIVTALTLLLMVRYVNNEMLNGNINVLILLAVLGGAWLALSGRYASAGFIIAAAACVKVTPALVIVWFAMKGWWRALAGAAAGVLVCLVLWPGLMLGWGENLRMLAAWNEHLLAGYLSRGDIYSIGTNQGLAALLNRLFGGALALQPDKTITLVLLPPPVLNALRAGLSLLVLGTLLWACRRRLTPGRAPLAFAAELGMVQVVMLVLSGYTWKAHYVAMLVPYVVILAYLCDARYPSSARRPVMWLLGLSVLLMSLSGDIVTPLGADYLLAYGVVLYSALAAGAALFLIRSALAQGPLDPLPAAAAARG